MPPLDTREERRVLLVEEIQESVFDSRFEAVVQEAGDQQDDAKRDKGDEPVEIIEIRRIDQDDFSDHQPEQGEGRGAGQF